VSVIADQTDYGSNSTTTVKVAAVQQDSCIQYSDWTSCRQTKLQRVNLTANYRSIMMINFARDLQTIICYHVYS